MPNPIDLPAELFTMIFDYAIDGKDDIQSLSNFRLVDRKWSATASFRLYSKWTYDGDAHSFTSLYKFLRTILHNAHLAGYVRVLDIQNWGFHSDLRSGEGASFPPENFAAIRDAVHKAGMQNLEPSIKESLRNNDRRPLMALLLAFLPNLRIMYAHTPEKDPYLAEVLRLSLETREKKFQQAFQNLEEVQIMSEWHIPHATDDEPLDNYVLGLEYLWPIFRLPNLRKLSVFDFDSKDASIRFKNCAGTSSVTHLTLVNHIDSYVSALDAHSLLTLPKALVSLTVYLDDYTLVPDEEPRQLSNDELWSALEPHRDSIEHLDFYRDCTGFSVPRHQKGNSHFGSLRTFKRLYHLCIQPDTLLGGCSKDPMAPFRLKDTLPPTLKDLTFYGAEGLLRNESLGEQICEVLENSDFINLTNIILEDVSQIEYYYTNLIHLPYQKVKRACKKHSINYRKINDRDERGSRKRTANVLLRGGVELPCFRKALEMRMKREDKWGREQELKRLAERRREFPESDEGDSEGVGIEWSNSDASDWDDWDSEELDLDMSDSEELTSKESESKESVSEDSDSENLESDEAGEA